MILDLQPTIDFLSGIEADYGAAEQEITQSGMNVTQLLDKWGVSQEQLLELAGLIAAQQEGVKRMYEAGMPSLPQMSIASMVSAEGYFDFLTRYPMERAAFRRLYTLALLTFLMSPMVPDDVPVPDAAVQEDAQLAEPASGPVNIPFEAAEDAVPES